MSEYKHDTRPEGARRLKLAEDRPKRPIAMIADDRSRLDPARRRGATTASTAIAGYL